MASRKKSSLKKSKSSLKKSKSSLKKSQPKHDMWKIGFFVLLILVIIQGAFIGWIVYIGNRYTRNETECALEVCGDEKFTAFYYDFYSDMCYCYEGEEITEWVYMR